jgi:hypothetical protein
MKLNEMYQLLVYVDEANKHYSINNTERNTEAPTDGSKGTGVFYKFCAKVT